jgi:hypothetical protein
MNGLWVLARTPSGVHTFNFERPRVLARAGRLVLELVQNYDGESLRRIVVPLQRIGDA